MGFLYLVLALFLFPNSSSGQIKFKEVADSVGINYSYPGVDFQMAGGGVTVIDVNGDGWEDIFQSGGVFDSKLWLNKQGKFEDASATWGLDSIHGLFVQGAVSSDFNLDGYPDLFLANYGTGMNRGDKRHPIVLVNSQDKFELIELKNVEIGNYSSAVLGDINQDGLTDIYLTNYIDKMGGLYDSVGKTVGYRVIGLPNKLLINQGNFQFEEVSESYQVDDSGCGLAANFTDMDNDGDLDLLLLNDFGMWTLNGNHYYRNEYPEKKFTDLSVETNFNQKMYGMGVGRNDFNNDGKLDYYLTNIGPNSMLSLDSNLTFFDRASELQINCFNPHEVRYSTSWTPLFFDADFDGDEDLYITLGNVATLVPPAKILDPNRFFENDNAKFKDISASTNTNDSLSHRGAAYLDYDHDGDLDIVSSVVKLPWAAYRGLEQKIKLYENQTPHGNYVAIQLKGKNREAFNIPVILHKGDQKQIRLVDNGSGQASQSTQIIYFGLGHEESYDKIEIQWSKQDTRFYSELEINAINKIQE